MGFRRKTRPGRLALLDRATLALEASLLNRRDGPWAEAPVVDLGIGARPWTTLELAALIAPLQVIGVDISEELVARARSLDTPNVSFVCGSFSLPMRGVRLIRVMNVLRDGPAEAVASAHTQLGESLLDGGLAIEGSCAPDGEVGTAHWLRKTSAGLVREGLVLWMDGSRGAHPMAFRDRLPRDLRGDRKHPVFDALTRWTDALHQLPASSDRLAAAAVSVDRLTPIPIEGGQAFKLEWRPRQLQS
ncbi:MAG: hypothetical protein ACI8RZ_003920 [Myxococcota bacterium]|jgi:hypothetical protein